MIDQTVPTGSFNFDVRIATVGPRGGVQREFDLDVSQVVIPRFVDAAAGDRVETADDLILRRGHTGSTEFYDWWDDQRNPKFRGTRNVGIALLDHEHRPVTVWRFTGCRLASLTYSPLDALESAVLVETVEIEFATIDQHSARR